MRLTWVLPNLQTNEKLARWDIGNAVIERALIGRKLYITQDLRDILATYWRHNGTGRIIATY